MHRDFAEWYSAGGRIANRLPIHDTADCQSTASLRYKPASIRIGGSAERNAHGPRAKILLDNCA